MSILRISALGDGATTRDWLNAKHAVHAGDASYVAPLALFEKRRLTAKHNPFFEIGSAAFFVAFRNGNPVGRISAQAHFDGHHGVSPDVGHFGFFDVTDDPEAAAALLERAKSWLRARGASSIRGPFSLSVNEECGCQISGFDIPSSYLMPQARPWTGGMIEQAGFVKCMDMQAWRMDKDGTSAALGKRSLTQFSGAGFTVRPIRMDRFREEMGLLADIFNDAWSENWGFVPFSPRAIELLAGELRFIFRASYGCFVEQNGVPLAVMVGVPNLNELIRPFGGALTPLNAIRLAWGLHRETYKSARVPILGIRKSHQGGLNGLMISAAMITSMWHEFERNPKDWIEFSWVLETNLAAQSGLKLLGAKPVSTYRIYERSL